MRDERDLIAAVAAAPTDDEPRLVYADWLMEREDPLGEFIVLQCARARDDENDIQTPPERLQRERALLSAYGERWTARARAASGGGYTIQRGFVEHLCLHSRDDFTAETGPALLESEPLMRGVSAPGEALMAHPRAPWDDLCALSLFEAGYGSMIPDLSLQKVRTLSLLNLHPRFDPLSLVRRMHRPERLEIVYGRYAESQIEGRSLLDALGAYDGLRALSLGGMVLRDLSPLRDMPHLQQLALMRTHATPSALLSLVGHMPSLRSLEIDEGGATLLSRLPIERLVEGLPSLRRLRVSGSGIGDRQGSALAQSPAAARLRRLDLSHNRITAAGIQILCESEHLSGLHYLSLSHNPVDHRRIAASNRRPSYCPPHRVYAPSIVGEIERGNKIPAIKEHRTVFQADLASAKQAVERVAEELQIDTIPNGVATRWIVSSCS